MKLNIDKTIQAADLVDAMRLRQGEKGKTLTFTLYDGENAYTPPVGGSVWLKVKHADGNFAIKQGTWSGNTVSIVTDTALTAVAGRCLHAYIEVRNVDNTVVATTGDIPMVILAAADLSGQQSEHYVPIIDEVVGDLESMTAAATSISAGSPPTAHLDKSADPWTMRFGIPKGQAATIEVGETSTGEPGTDADVENVGTDTDAVFNFTIPKGAKGDKGDQGDPGNYTKPATGIPKSDLASGVQDALIPAGGITIDELAQAVADRLLIAGGAAGQALLKNSEDDYDAVWGDVVAPGDIIPLSDGGTGGNYAGLDALLTAMGGARKVLRTITSGVATAGSGYTIDAAKLRIFAGRVAMVYVKAHKNEAIAAGTSFTPVTLSSAFVPDLAVAAPVSGAIVHGMIVGSGNVNIRNAANIAANANIEFVSTYILNSEYTS